METTLKDFKKKVKIINKDFAQYESEDELQVFNTANLLESVTKLELELNEYTYMVQKGDIDKLDYTHKKVKKVVPKSTITGKKDDQFTLVDKEVDVRVVYVRQNLLKIKECYTTGEEATKEAKANNEEIYSKLG